MDDDTDVHLRWNHHQTTLLSVFSSLLNNENLADCTISAECQHFKAHRVILSACSPYFELLFSEHCEIHPVVILPDVKFQILKPLMEFMYYGEIKIPEDKLSAVLELAETLQIKGLSSVGDSEMKDNLRPKRRNESSSICDQLSFKKHLREHRSSSQVNQKADVSSLHTSEKESSEVIDFNQLSRSSKDMIGKQGILSENVLLMCSSSKGLRKSEALGMNSERLTVDVLPEMKQEDQNDFRDNNIEEIILDYDTDGNDDHDSGEDNRSTVGRMVPEQFFSGLGFSSVEQCRDDYFVEPASLLPKQFKCNVCGRSYQYRKCLLRHLKYECGKEPQFSCCYCPGRFFFHNHDLNKHISRIHSAHKI